MRVFDQKFDRIQVAVSELTVDAGFTRRRMLALCVAKCGLRMIFPLKAMRVGKRAKSRWGVMFEADRAEWCSNLGGQGLRRGNRYAKRTALAHARTAPPVSRSIIAVRL